MKKLPSSKWLAGIISAAKRGRQTVGKSQAYLLSQRAVLAKFSGVVDFITRPETEKTSLEIGFEFHLAFVRAAIARELWSRQFFIGASVLDDLVFSSFAHDATASPILRVLEIIRDKGLHSPGLVVYPVHSFGILGAALLHWKTDARIELILESFGIAVSPQTNSIERTFQFLERTRDLFGIHKKAPRDLIEHWYRSRPTKWLIRNPLLIIKTQSFPGEYYENQWLILTAVRAATGLICMLASLQPDLATDTDAVRWSSSSLNNFQTLDIRHYLVLFSAPGGRKEMNGDCVPMHVTSAALAELCELNVEFDSKYWRRRSSEIERLGTAVQKIHAGFLKFSMMAKEQTVESGVFRKMFDALSYFRRSLRRADGTGEGIVSLAIAFEMVLTDSYSPGVTARIVRRARLVLRGTSGVRAMTKELETLYNARSIVVHRGVKAPPMNLALARRAFVMVFVCLSERLSTLSNSTTEPMRTLCGD